MCSDIISFVPRITLCIWICVYQWQERVKIWSCKNMFEFEKPKIIVEKKTMSCKQIIICFLQIPIHNFFSCILHKCILAEDLVFSFSAVKVHCWYSHLTHIISIHQTRPVTNGGGGKWGVLFHTTPATNCHTLKLFPKITNQF